MTSEIICFIDMAQYYDPLVLCSRNVNEIMTEIHGTLLFSSEMKTKIFWK